MSASLSVTPAVERIARVLAGQRLSANAEGASPSAALDVDVEWEDRVDEAITILKAIREPDRAMADAGDAAIWERMVSMAIDQADRYE
jgi:hypothetical protein